MADTARADVVLVGAGIMSATLAAMLRRLEPDWTITLIERLDAVGAESSSPWNNAGTGHSALCEMNYTPQRRDGSIDISKAVHVNEQFQVTRQFWAYATESGILADVGSFLNPTPHVSFVHGAARVEYLRQRQRALAGNPLFAATELIEDPGEFARRLPLMASKRDFAEPVALNWGPDGTDVDFGALSRQLVGYCVRNGASALFGHEVRRLSRESNGSWTLTVINRRTGQQRRLNTKFVFVGAGGDALPLLQRAGIGEVKGFAGFPIGGRFIRTADPALVAAHRAKVYGFPAAGAPPLGALHLDLRLVNGKPWLVFGPYAGWSPKFLKYGHGSDLPRSMRPHNVASMVDVAVAERKMVGYLIGQLRLSQAGRIRLLREFVPTASASDWESVIAGQRVQVIRRDGRRGGALEFGTTVLTSGDGRIAGLLGGSPGASTAVPIMLEVLKRCFMNGWANRYRTWLPTLQDMVPSLGAKLSEEPDLYQQVQAWTTNVLKLDKEQRH